MTFFSLLLTSLSANAASRLVTTAQSERPHFDIQLLQNKEITSISSKGARSYIEYNQLEQDHTTPLHITLVEMNDKHSNIRFSIQHQYQLTRTCSTLEYTYWTESISLYEENQVFRPNAQELLERKETLHIPSFFSANSSKRELIDCDIEIEQSVYTIAQGKKIIKEIVLVPETQY